MAAVASDPGADVIINAITNRVAEFVNARFAAIEGRLVPDKVRPQLKAEKRSAAAAKAKSYAEAAAASKSLVAAGPKGLSPSPLPQPKPPTP